nr:retinoic acid receptor responder protein 2 [Aotus nancymaae]
MRDPSQGEVGPRAARPASRLQPRPGRWGWEEVGTAHEKKSGKRRTARPNFSCGTVRGDLQAQGRTTGVTRKHATTTDPAGPVAGRGGRGQHRAHGSPGAGPAGGPGGIPQAPTRAVDLPEDLCVQREDTPFPAGIFVRLEFKLQQTDCRKEDWKKPHCKVKPNGRKRKCLACIKLGPENKVLGRMIHCPTKTQVLRELKEYQENQCIKVQQAGEDPNSFGFPGNAALLQGPAQH